jgi:hypothetical protein
MLLYFAYKALFKHMAINWYSPAVVVAFVFVVNKMLILNYKKWFYIGVAIATTLTLLIKFPDQFYLKYDANSKSRVMGLKEGAYEFMKMVPKDSLICTDYYSTSSILNYYFPQDSKRVIEVFTYDRKSDYDFWYDINSYDGKSCYVFAKGKLNNQEKSLCQDIKLIKTYVYKKEPYSKRKFYFYKCNKLLIKDRLK